MYQTDGTIKETAKTLKDNTVILHSRGNDVIPFAESEELPRNSHATLFEVGTDHRLADPDPLAAMLRACGGDARWAKENFCLGLRVGEKPFLGECSSVALLLSSLQVVITIVFHQSIALFIWPLPWQRVLGKPGPTSSVTPSSTASPNQREKLWWQISWVANAKDWHMAGKTSQSASPRSRRG